MSTGRNHVMENGPTYAAWRGHPISRFIKPNSAYAPLVCELPCNVVNMSFEAACSIGAYTYANYQVAVGSPAQIGRYCSIGQQVMIGLGAHSTNFVSTHPIASDPSGASCGLYELEEYSSISATQITQPPNAKNGEVKIGNDVWIGARAIILSGVEIGDGAVIAAASVVRSNVEPYSIVGGSPARHIKYRFDETTRSRLARVAWWKRDLAVLGKNRDYSDVDLFLDLLEQLIEKDKLPLISYDRIRVNMNMGAFLQPGEDLGSGGHENNISAPIWMPLS